MPLSHDTESYFLNLWATLLDLGINLKNALEVLVAEAPNDQLQRFCQEFKSKLRRKIAVDIGLAELSKDFSELFSAPVKLILLKAKDADDLKNRLLDLKELSDMLRESAPDDSHMQGSDWLCLSLLAKYGSDTAEAFTTLAQLSNQRQCSNKTKQFKACSEAATQTKSFTSTLVSNAQGLLRHYEIVILGAAIGTSEAPETFMQLSKLAQLKASFSKPTEPQKPEPAKPKPAPEAKAPSSEKAPTKTHPDQNNPKKPVDVDRFVRSLSATFSNVSETISSKLGLDKQQSGSITQAPRAQPIRRVANRKPTQHKPPEARPVIRVSDKPNQDFAKPRSNVKKTIGPDWYDMPEEPETHQPDPTPQSHYPDLVSAEPVKPTSSIEKISLTIKPRKSEPDHQTEVAINGENISTTRLRAHLVLLQTEPDAPQSVADTLAAEIKKLRAYLEELNQPDLEPLRHELDDIELEFGAWKASQ